MIAFLLWALATVDAAFIGYREAAGRSALINKGAYYRRAMMRGALFGQIAVVIAGAAIALILIFSPSPSALMHDLQEAGRRMLIVYVPYALIILITFAVRVVPSVDLRSITSVLIFGPFTLIRPLIVVAGIAWGFLAAPGPATFLLAALILSLMLSLEWVMGRLRARSSVQGRVK
ncbi:MAG: hypothetical protein ICV60_22155 [Pyrinomonadaceae bacterium]|nr:hypothetical protein [Pyrinomonadaceae bacterium]